MLKTYSEHLSEKIKVVSSLIVNKLEYVGGSVSGAGGGFMAYNSVKDAIISILVSLVCAFLGTVIAHYTKKWLERK